MENVCDTVRSAIREERIRRRITQANLASEIGRSRKWLIDYEKGGDASFGDVVRLAVRLGIVLHIMPDEEFRTRSSG